MLANFGADLWRTAAAECGVGPALRRALAEGSRSFARLSWGSPRVTSIPSRHREWHLQLHPHPDGRAQQGFRYGPLQRLKPTATPSLDPPFDIEGYDTAHKAAILASLAFQQDVRYAVDVRRRYHAHPTGGHRARSRTRLHDPALRNCLARSGRRSSRGACTPRSPRPRFFAHVNGVYNGILAVGDLVGKTMFYGRGAGPAPTASAVLSDAMAAATAVAAGTKPAEHRLAAEPGVKNLKPIAELSTAYYLRLEAIDRLGVMAQLMACWGA